MLTLISFPIWKIYVRVYCSYRKLKHFGTFFKVKTYCMCTHTLEL